MSYIRTCHQRSQDNTAPPGGLQRHSPDAKGAVGVASLPESLRKPGPQASLCFLESFPLGLRLGEAGGGGGHLGPGYSGPSYALLPLTLFLGGRVLVLAAIRGRRLGHGAGAAAGGGQEVGRLQDGLRVLASFHAQGSHAGRAVALAAVGGKERQPHGVWDTARAQRAP